MTTTVELENERVRVLRVKHAKGESHPVAARGDRLVIYLTDARIVRTVEGKQETLTRKAGEVVWRDHSQHQVQNAAAGGHEVLIVELK
jgi:hypothetical protein